MVICNTPEEFEAYYSQCIEDLKSVGRKVVVNDSSSTLKPIKKRRKKENPNQIKMAI